MPKKIIKKTPIKKPKTKKVTKKKEKVLTNKETSFIQEYLKDFNGTQAAIRSGYSFNTACSIGSENLRKPHIKIRIDAHKEAIRKANNLSIADIVKDLQHIKNLALQLKPVIVFDRKTQQHIETGELKLDLKAAAKATELLGKTIGAFNEDNKLSIEGQIVHLDKKDFKKVIKDVKGSDDV